jgi:hypothetical protein
LRSFLELSREYMMVLWVSPSYCSMTFTGQEQR